MSAFALDESNLSLHIDYMETLGKTCYEHSSPVHKGHEKLMHLCSRATNDHTDPESDIFTGN